MKPFFNPHPRKLQRNSYKRSVSHKRFFNTIKNQKKCKSCYLTAAISVIEGTHAMNFNEYIRLSLQEIIDCDNKNQGCRGGFPSKVADYIINYGIGTAKWYPYIASTNGKCYAEYANNRQTSRHGPRLLEELLMGSFGQQKPELGARMSPERNLQAYDYFNPYRSFNSDYYRRFLDPYRYTYNQTPRYQEPQNTNYNNNPNPPTRPSKVDNLVNSQIPVLVPAPVTRKSGKKSSGRIIDMRNWTVTRSWINRLWT